MRARNSDVSLPTASESIQAQSIAIGDALLPERMLNIALPVFAILLGACRAWAGRFQMAPDGISYIEIGEAYLRRDWHAALSAYWSPLYTWLLGAGLAVFRPSAYWEFPVVHLVNFVIYLVALGCFHFFLAGLVRYQESLRDERRELRVAAIPKLVWLGFGYALFLLSSLEMITLSAVTPDMCVAAFVYLASGIVVRIHSGKQARGIYFVLGICLGFGYLAKAAMLPVSFIFIVASFSPGTSLRKALRRASVTLAGLALIAGPSILALSKQQGHLTFSETPRLAYASMVNLLPQVHWQGGPPGFGYPKHPTRKINDHPDAFEFGSPVPGSYPPWRDPVYWNEGVTPHFDLRQETIAMVGNGVNLFDLFFGRFEGGVVAGILVLYLFGGSRRLVLRHVAGQWFLYLPSLAAFMMYFVVLVASRYLGAYFTVFSVGLISGLCLPDLLEFRRLLMSITVPVVSVTLAIVLTSTATDLITSHRVVPEEWQVADYLYRVGIRPADRVAEIGMSYDWGWARLARVQITAEIPRASERDFDAAGDEVKSKVLHKLFGTGVKAIVSRRPYESGCETGWQGNEKTNVYVCTAPGVRPDGR